MDGIEAEVTSNKFVMVGFGHAVVAEEAEAVCELLGLADGDAAIACAAEVFCGEEAEPGGGGDGAGVECAVARGVTGACGLGGVFDDIESVLVCNIEDFVHTCAMAKEVDGNDGADFVA